MLFMGKSERNKRIRCSCGLWGSSKTSGLCPKCYRRGKNKETKRKGAESLDATPSTSKDNPSKKKSVSGGKMDSKHFSSRSTTDNLPSSLSTPGERAGLTSASSAAVDTTSVTTTSTSTNTMSPHLSSTCGTSGPGDITSHSANPVTAELEVDSSRLPSDATDSESLHSSTTSDKTYDPKCDSNVCSSSSNSCSSLASSLSAVISSSSKGHNDEFFVTDFQGSGLSCTEGPSLSQMTKNSITSSITSNNVQNIGLDTAANVEKTVTSSNSNKDNLSATERPDDQSKEGLSSTQNAKSHPAIGLLAAGSRVLKDSKSTIEDPCPQSPLSRGVKRTHEEIEEPSESSPSPKPSPQKNKKRCFICSCKLELAQRTIGKCRCEHVFCPIHRLPELHDCVFNHKEDGRREAREKMVKPTRHMGTSFRRDDQT